MIIKSFTAESAAAALKRVREEMGGDAVVLKTRRVAGDSAGSLIEVTACLDQASVGQASEILSQSPIPERVSSRLESLDMPSTPTGDAGPASIVDQVSQRLNQLESRLTEMTGASQKAVAAHMSALVTELAARTVDRYPVSADVDAALYGVQLALRDADVPETFATLLLTSLQQETQDSRLMRGEARRLLVESLAGMMLPSLELQPGDSLMVIGPAGVGKTSLIGKLAAHLVANDSRKVRLLSLDRSKIGAHDEIQSYAELLGIETAEPESTDSLKPKDDPKAVTLIDTAGLPYDVDRLNEYIRSFEQVQASHRLVVFSALTRSADVETIAARLRVFSPTHIAVTMLDLTHRYGAIIAACESLGAKLVYVTDAPGGVGKLGTPDPARTAAHLIPTEESHEQA